MAAGTATIATPFVIASRANRASRHIARRAARRGSVSFHPSNNRNQREYEILAAYFFPDGIVWEIGNGVIRTRNYKTGQIIMRTGKVNGDAESWVAASRCIWNSKKKEAA